MLPVHRTFCVMVFLGMVMMINSGCGKKHLHVSTMSGAPGEGELAMGLDESNDQDGLGANSGLDESGLGNQGEDSTASSTDTNDLEPLDFTHDIPAPSQTQDTGEQLAGLSDGLGSAGDQVGGTETPGQEIQTQSHSLPSLDPQGDGSENLNLTAPSNSNGGGVDNPNLGAQDSDNFPPLVAFNTPDEPISGGPSELGDSESDSSDFPLTASGTTGDEEGSLPVEQIPGNIAVAKAEPSDAFREQLDEIKEQEAATLSAGLNDIFFEFDSWTLTEEGRQALDEGADWLRKDSSSKLLIEGHCDARGTQAYNQVLGKKRASAIKEYLVELGDYAGTSIRCVLWTRQTILL